MSAVRHLGGRKDPRARAAVVDALYDRRETAVTEAAVAVMVMRGDAADSADLLAALGRDDHGTAGHVRGFLTARAGASPFAQGVLDRSK
jgi:hypothetical protein